MSTVSIQIDKEIENINFETKKTRLYPLLKWAGGKEQELKYILPNMPKNFISYFEPFVGGGSVYTSIKAKNYYINDKSHELVDLYKIIVGENRGLFFHALEEINHNWDILGKISEKNKEFFIVLYKDFAKDSITKDVLIDKIYEFVLKNSQDFNGLFSTYFNFNIENFIKEIKKNLIRKISRMKVLEKERGILPEKDITENIETALKSAFYMHFRFLYNHHEKYKLNPAFYTAIFLFIRNFAYSGMFRYNQNGEFNVPYGGIAYNNKNFRKKIQYLESIELFNLLERTRIFNEDFEFFLEKNTPSKTDFIFLDPPYDSEFSTYAQNEFGKSDQERLAEYLINKCEAKWMMIIKNTEFILKLYTHPKVNISTFDKNYLVSFMNRNDKKVEHLLITNY